MILVINRYDFRHNLGVVNYTPSMSLEEREDSPQRINFDVHENTFSVPACGGRR
ncbi:MAG: hypothetical protein P8P81_08395 [Bacteroidia bacterium]|nr:hypothetical protein [Bacteroidia bacterium]